MLYAGLDLSRQRLDVHLLDEDGRTVEVTAVRPDGDALRTLVAVVERHGHEVTAAIESMNGARFVHDTLERHGWDVEIATRSRSRASRRWPPRPTGSTRGSSPSRTALKNRIHATLIAFGHPVPVSDLFGARGRELLAALTIPEPWATTLATSLRFVDELDAEIAACERELRAHGAEHPYIPLLMTAPGIAWVLGYTIAAELGDIGRFASPKKLTGYTGLCPFVRQSGRRDDRGPLAKNGPKYLRWALIEAATHAARHPAYRERYERTKQRLGRQRGSKVARVEIARELSTAIWHMLTKNEPFAPGRPHVSALVA
jgi:transposase